MSAPISSEASIADDAEPSGLPLTRAFWLLIRLRITRWKNRGRSSFWGSVVAPTSSSSPRRTTSARSGAALLIWAVLLLAVFSLQFLKLFEQLVLEHGAAGMHGRAVLMCCLYTSSLALMVLLGGSVWERQGHDEADWLATLPAPAWVLHTAKVAQAALSNLMAWMLLFPFFTGLALHGGLGPLAPLVALALCVPIFLAVGLIGSVCDLAGVAASRSRALRVSRFLASALGALIYALALLSSGLSGLKIDLLGGWLDFSQQIAWLPFSEPAQALLSWRTAPLHSLGWFSVFATEMGALLSTGALLLRGVYRAGLVARGSEGRGKRRPLPASSPGLREHPFGGWLGAVAAKELLWLRRSPARTAQLAAQIAISNGLAALLLPRVRGIDAAALPGAALFGVGVVLVLNLSTLLEPERAAMVHWATLPRSLSWFFSRKALFAAGVATAGALPSAGHLLRTAPSVESALPALGYGMVCVVVLAFLQTGFWLRQLSTEAATSPHTLRTIQVLFAAAVLSSTFGTISRPDTLVASIVFAVALAASFWLGSVERVPFVLDPSTPRPATLSVTGTFITLMLMRIVQSGIFSAATRGGVSASSSTAVSFITAGVCVLGARLLWLKLQGATSLRHHFGLTLGKGLFVVVKQGLLWSLLAIGISLAYFALLKQWLQTSADLTQPTPMMMLVSGSSAAVVLVACVAAPMIEELGYRGMFYGSLRLRWTVLPSLLLSTLVFTADHSLLGAVPVFCLSACATLAFERSRSLYAAMLTHALYNVAHTALSLLW